MFYLLKNSLLGLGEFWYGSFYVDIFDCNCIIISQGGDWSMQIIFPDFQVFPDQSPPCIIYFFPNDLSIGVTAVFESGQVHVMF